MNSSLLHAMAAAALVQTVSTLAVAEPEAPAEVLAAQLTALVGRPDGLTADHVARRARDTSFDVQARAADADVSQAAVDQASAAYAPRIKGTASYQRSSPVAVVLGPVGTFQSPQDNWNLQVDLDVPLSDYVLKLSKQHAAAEHGLLAAKLTERASELTASSNARIQYYAWARARLQTVVAAVALELSRAHGSDAQAELDAGKASPADRLAVDAQVAESELALVRAQSAEALEEDRLRTALHVGAGAPFEIGEALLSDLAPLPDEGDFLGLLAQAQRDRPELGSLHETAIGQRAQATASRYDTLPKLDGTGTAQYANPNIKDFPPRSVWNGTWAIGGAVTWSLDGALLGATQASSSAARARSSDAQAASMRDAVRDEVLDAWQSVRVAEVAITSTQRSLASAEEAYRVRRALFRAGRSTSTELTDSENALTTARLAAVNARIDLRTARVRLTHATGRDDV